jgi:hypothetical protein
MEPLLALRELTLVNVIRIFRYVFWHSIALTAIVGAIVLLYAYVYPGAVLHGR